MIVTDSKLVLFTWYDCKSNMLSSFRCQPDINSEFYCYTYAEKKQKKLLTKTTGTSYYHYLLWEGICY